MRSIKQTISAEHEVRRFLQKKKNFRQLSGVMAIKININVFFDKLICSPFELNIRNMVQM